MKSHADEGRIQTTKIWDIDDEVLVKKKKASVGEEIPS
jgi:hypothetical protein